MIANTQHLSKGFKIAALTTEVKELRSIVDRRSQLMKLRMGLLFLKK
jgi:hypothetical protein